MQQKTMPRIALTQATYNETTGAIGLNHSIFQASSSLLDAGALARLASNEKVDETDVSRVAEFFSLLRDRLQNELPHAATQQLSDSFKQSLIDAMEKARKVKPK